MDELGHPARVMTVRRCDAASWPADPLAGLLRPDHRHLQDRAARLGRPEWHSLDRVLKGERTDHVVQRYRARFGKREGVVCVGVAQEKAKTWSATKAVRERSVQVAYRWKTVCVNHDYLYVLDRERGPALLG